MKKTSKELREERKVVKDEIASITKDAETREFSAEEKTKLRTLMDKETSLTEEIELTSDLEKRALAEAGKTVGTTNPLKPEEREKGEFSFGKMLREASNGGKFTGLEKELLDDSAKEARELGISPSGHYLSNSVLEVKQKRTTMIAGTGNLGGDFIAIEKIGFFDAFYAKTVLAGLGVEYMSGLSQNTDLPGFGAGVTVGWETEVSAADVTNPTVANRTLRPKRLAAYSDISKQLLIQTNNSIENYLMQTYMKALASALEAAFINGSTPAPTGLLGTANIGSVAIGANGGPITLAKILEMVQTIGTANAPTENLKWLINPKVEAKLKQTPIDSGAVSGAMIMAYQQYFTGTPGVIDGKPVAVTSNVPSNLTKGTTAGVCSAIIVGDWSNMVVGQFGGLDIVVDPYSQAVNGTVRVVVNQFVDMAIKQPAAFCACLDVTTT